MLTKLIIRNFKRFKEVEIELGNPVVFIGPNNSGKTSALQALSLWELGMRRWTEKRKGQKGPRKQRGITINRRDLIMLPAPNAKLLWLDLHIRNVQRIDGKQQIDNVFMDIIAEGISDRAEWQCGFEFYYANEESLYCRPLRLSEDKNPDRLPVPEEAQNVRLAFLPPMSGLASNETRIDEGAINVRIGEGRTAEVLRNLCLRIHIHRQRDVWKKLVGQIDRLFACQLDAPEYIAERGEVRMSYTERGTQLDLSSSGRGFQQTLLVLAYMYANPGAVLLLDEPAAHLEILRQRQTYQLLTDVARENGNQIIAASHSEVLLDEATQTDVVVAFVGKPHRIDDRGSQVRKALTGIGFEHYYQAELKGWVLYLEGSTDLGILRTFAERLSHAKASECLERPFVHYCGNDTGQVSSHYHGLHEAVPQLVGLAIFDRLDKTELPGGGGLRSVEWRRREIENYLCYRETLIAYAEGTAKDDSDGPIFAQPIIERRVRAMQKSIEEIEQAKKTLGEGSPWDNDTKVSNEFLKPLFNRYYEKLNLPNAMEKKNFHVLARYVPIDKIDPEITEKLDAIVKVANESRPMLDEY
ncbi:AAA family ATPase [bacterium]|nr:AAA family ATPase [bacterium]